MSNIQEYADKEGIQLWEAFDRAWKYCYRKPCGSNQMLLDMEKFKKRKVQPGYVVSFLSIRKPVMPEQAIRASRWGHQFNLQEQLVSESAPILMAHKSPDGVWRC